RLGGADAELAESGVLRRAVVGHDPVVRQKRAAAAWLLRGRSGLGGGVLGGAGVDPRAALAEREEGPHDHDAAERHAGGDLPLAADAAAGDVAALLDRARAAGRVLHAATLLLWRAYQALYPPSQLQTRPSRTARTRTERRERH